MEKVCKEKIKKYRKMTTEALKMARRKIRAGKEKEADEIFKMVSCYLSDSEHFESKNDFVNALACLSYAHGWLDCGARLGIFDVNDNRLFAV